MSGVGQDEKSADQNAEFFSRDLYGDNVAELDSYRMIREAVSEEVAGTELLLDVGNGGVFEYDTTKVGSIVAVDLFLDQLPADRFPENVTARAGDALALDEPANHYDAALQAFLFHHLVGKAPGDMERNAITAMEQAREALKPGGRLIVAESCVPAWFYGVERVMFRPLTWLAKTPLTGGHPATMQLTFKRLKQLVAERFEIESAYKIPTGRWLTQFGRKFPTALTPARPYMIVARKREG